MAAPATNEPRINDRIRAREVRLVSPEGEQIGIRPLPEALHIARELDLDLVEVAPQANPPVCRIMDYGKFKYEAAQKAKESRRKTTQISIKEMKYRPKIGRGDFDTKTRKVEHFLGEGHKVKLTIMFRGREVHHPELGMKILENVAEEVKHLAKVEASPRLDGRNMTMVLAPDKRAQAAHAAALKEADKNAADGEAVADDEILPTFDDDLDADDTDDTDDDDIGDDTDVDDIGDDTDDDSTDTPDVTANGAEPAPADDAIGAEPVASVAGEPPTQQES